MGSSIPSGIFLKSNKLVIGSTKCFIHGLEVKLGFNIPITIHTTPIDFNDAYENEKIHIYILKVGNNTNAPVPQWGTLISSGFATLWQIYIPDSYTAGVNVGMFKRSQNGTWFPFLHTAVYT